MRLTEDRILIYKKIILKRLLRYGAKTLIKEFPTKVWRKTPLKDISMQLRDTGLAEPKSSSGRSRTACTNKTSLCRASRSYNIEI